MPVLHRKGEHRLVGFFDPTALLTDGFLIGRHYSSRFVLNKHGGVFAFMLTDAAVLSGSNAPSRFGELCTGVHVDKKIALCIAGRYGMSDLFSDPASPCIHCRVGKVDAVAGVCELKAGFCIYLDRQCYIVESGFSSEASGIACESNADSLVRVDPIALCASKELDKRRCICVCERKYFSGTSFSKISDNIHALSGLGDTEILAVKDLPCDSKPGTFSSSRKGGLLTAAILAISKKRVPLVSSWNPLRSPAILKD